MREAQLFILVALVALWPSPAFAAKGFWGWLEEMSGPGPFTGAGISAPVACVRDDGGRMRDCYSRIDPHIRETIVVSVAWMTSGEGPRFKDLDPTDPDNRGKVRVVPITGAYMLRPVRAVDVGAGAGVLHGSGDGPTDDTDFTFNKLLLVPVSAALSPFALRPAWQRKRWAYVLRLEVDTWFVPQGFKGSDFKNTRTTFDSGAEFLTRTAVVVDVGALLR
jgi:hypothetical protein